MKHNATWLIKTYNFDAGSDGVFGDGIISNAGDGLLYFITSYNNEGKIQKSKEHHMAS